jgi:rare lipoprotein A
MSGRYSHFLTYCRYASVYALTTVILASCSYYKATPHHTSKGAYYKVGTPYKINGELYTPREQPNYDEVGIASWYGPTFHGKLTANGDIFDENALTAAHKTLPLPSVVRVTNLQNGRSLIVTVNDRGPFSKGRIIDVSKHTAKILGFKEKGTAKVRVQFLPGQTAKIVSTLPRAPQSSAQYAALQGNTKLETNNTNKTVLATEVDAHVLQKVAQPPMASADIASDEESLSTSDTTPGENLPKEGDESDQSSTPPDVNSSNENEATNTPPKHYFIQAGTYRMESNADFVKGKLSALGDVQIEMTSLNNQHLHRVRLGPIKKEMKQYILEKVIGLGHPDAIVIYE